MTISAPVIKLVISGSKGSLRERVFAISWVCAIKKAPEGLGYAPVKGYGNYFRPFSSAHNTVRMPFTGYILSIIYLFPLTDERAMVKIVCEGKAHALSLIHISEPTRRTPI